MGKGPVSGQGSRWFDSTHWTLVLQAGEVDSTEASAALEELCRSYWPPLYSYARYLGLPPADAEDLTQSFFEDLLSRGAIARADAERGRFRTFLLTSFKNHHSRLRTAASRLKRGGGRIIVSLESLKEAELQFQPEPGNGYSPEEWFDRRWALSVLTRALELVRHEYRKRGHTEVFDELKALLWGGDSRIGYAEIAERLGMTEGAIKVAVYRLRRRFGERVRAEVAKTVLKPEDTEEEIRYLLSRVSELP